jgi:hypothetical protein
LGEGKGREGEGVKRRIRKRDNEMEGRRIKRPGSSKR